MYCRNCGEAIKENQSICLKCGVETRKGESFCYYCGKAVAKETVVCANCGASLKESKEKTIINVNTYGIQKRSIVTAIILSFITFGIYAIYWFVHLTDEISWVSGRTGDTSGGAAYLLSWVTCGIYGFFWAYKLGEKRDIIANKKGFSNILYPVLSIFGLTIVVYCLAQHTLNKAIEDNK